MRILFRFHFTKNKIILVIPYFLQPGTLHIPDAVLKERDGRYKTVCAPLNFYDQNRILLHGVHSREIRFKRMLSCDGVDRQRTEEGILKAQFVNFHFVCVTHHDIESIGS